MASHAPTLSGPGIYFMTYKSFMDVPAGATISIPQDRSNDACSLQIPAADGIMTLKDPASTTDRVLSLQPVKAVHPDTKGRICAELVTAQIGRDARKQARRPSST